MVLLLIALAGCSLTSSLDGMGSQSVGAGPVVLQSTPEEAVTSFYQAVDGYDFASMQALMEPTDNSNKSFMVGFRQGITEGISGETTNIRTHIVEQTDDMVRIQVNHHQTTYRNDELLLDNESGNWFTLVKEDGCWYFIGLGDPVPPGWTIE